MTTFNFIPTRLTMIRGGVEYPLSDGTTIYTGPDGVVTLYYVADDGLGMAQVQRFSERGPSQHGVTDIGFLLEPRTVSYIFAIHAPTTGYTRNLEEGRRYAMRMFRPGNDTLSFRYNRANESVRQIDGHFTGGMQFSSADREPGTWFQRFSVDFLMPDPTWYDPTAVVVALPNTLWTSGMPIPLPVPFSVGASGFSATTDIPYPGTWETYPDIRVYGPLKDFTISNTSLGLVLPFVGEIEMGTYWDIHLSGGLKTVIDSAGVSRISALQDPNNLDTFRISPAPDAPGGINTITLVGDGANGVTSASITYVSRYIGI